MNDFRVNQTTTLVHNGITPTRLSERELDVLRLLCQEYTSKEIADKLYISYRTVEGHRRRMQEKTGARNIVGLVLYAVRHRLV